MPSVVPRRFRAAVPNKPFQRVRVVFLHSTTPRALHNTTTNSLHAISSQKQPEPKQICIPCQQTSSSSSQKNYVAPAPDQRHEEAEVGDRARHQPRPQHHRSTEHVPVPPVRWRAMSQPLELQHLPHRDHPAQAASRPPATKRDEAKINTVVVSVQQTGHDYACSSGGLESRRDKTAFPRRVEVPKPRSVEPCANRDGAYSPRGAKPATRRQSRGYRRVQHKDATRPEPIGKKLDCCTPRRQGVMSVPKEGRGKISSRAELSENVSVVWYCILVAG